MASLVQHQLMLWFKSNQIKSIFIAAVAAHIQIHTILIGMKYIHQFVQCIMVGGQRLNQNVSVMHINSHTGARDSTEFMGP